MHAFKIPPFSAALALSGALLLGPSAGADDRYLKAVFGAGNLDDGGSLAVDDPRFVGDAEADYGTGFASGLAFGAHLSPRWVVEGEYLYRTSDFDRAVFADGETFEDGNYASVVLSGSVYYLFGDDDDRLRPYVGAGLGWIQEVDVDFERGGEEISFETDDFGVQGMVGLRWRLGEKFLLDLQGRWLSASDITMEAEEGDGRVIADYEPLDLLVGIGWRF
ncbi:MAG: OmpW family outer membrane protein [Acidobacteriota bacterium]